MATAPPQLVNDLTTRITEAVERAQGPFQEVREMIEERLNTLRREERELQAQLERLDRVDDAFRLKKRAGRPSGSRSAKEKVAA